MTFVAKSWTKIIRGVFDASTLQIVAQTRHLGGSITAASLRRSLNPKAPMFGMMNMGVARHKRRFVGLQNSVR